MRLEYEKKYSAGAITVLLNLTDITAEEQKAIAVIGEPILVLEKTYKKTNTKVNINIPITKINTISVEFKTNFETALIDYTDPDSYINDVRESLRQLKDKLMESYQEYLDGKEPDPTPDPDDPDSDAEYCKEDGHIHIYSGEELTDEAVNKMKDGEIFAIIQEDGEED